ncbi:hypothetical protein D3C84_1286760 [compost metagenome]
MLIAVDIQGYEGPTYDAVGEKPFEEFSNGRLAYKSGCAIRKKARIARVQCGYVLAVLTSYCSG